MPKLRATEHCTDSQIVKLIHFLLRNTYFCVINYHHSLWSIWHKWLQFFRYYWTIAIARLAPLCVPWHGGRPAVPDLTPGFGLGYPSFPPIVGTWLHTSSPGPVRKRQPPAPETISSVTADTTNTQTQHSVNRVLSHGFYWAHVFHSWSEWWDSILLGRSFWWHELKFSMNSSYLAFIYFGNNIAWIFQIRQVTNLSDLYCWVGL